MSTDTDPNSRGRRIAARALILTRHRASRTLAMILVLVITWLSLTPQAVVTALGSDKLGHALAYGTLTLFWVRSRRWSWPRLGKIWLAAVAFGAALEVLQPLFGRFFSWEDILADAVGAAIGCLIGALTTPRRPSLDPALAATGAAENMTD